MTLGVAAAGGQDDPAIVVRGLVKRYGGRAVVDGLSFDIGRGEIFGLLGPNGAGKTTAVEILEGYRKADGGEVRVLGLDPARDASPLRPTVGLMLQENGIYPQARPAEIVRLFARFHARPHDPDALLDTVGLLDAATTPYRRLSGGQKQRLGLALALVGRPELVILDEPTAGMDPAAKAATRELIADLRSAGVTVLLTTHELADVERLADRVAVIDHGRLVALAPPSELASGAPQRLRFTLDRALTDEESRELEAALAGESAGVEASVRVLGEGVGRYRLDGADPSPALVRAVAAWCADRGALVVELRTGGGTLEERYLELLGAEARHRD